MTAPGTPDSPTNPYSDGTIPEDADFAPAGSDQSSPVGEDADADDSDPEPAEEVGSGSAPEADAEADPTLRAGWTPGTEVDGPGNDPVDPLSLVRGNRVATAEDME